MRIIVFAPHPDDDILGCGGAIIKHVRKKDLVEIVYMTDGRFGFLSFGINDISPEDLAEVRKKEAKAASKELGVSEADLMFLNYEDLSLQKNMRSAAKKVKNIVCKINPDLVYVPHENEKHRDHTATNKIVRRVLPQETRVYQYEVWEPLHPADIILDVSDVLHIKRRAAYRHQSQLKVVKDLFEKILQRNYERFKTLTPKNHFRGVRKWMKSRIYRRHARAHCTKNGQ